MGHQKRIRDEKRRHKILVGILCLLTLGMWAASGTPEKKLPKQDDPDKVYLVNSDELTFDKEQSADYRVLRGNVVFRKDSMYMYCDSAYFYEKDNSLDAFSNVRMEQGDTLFIYGDVLYYRGDEQIARLRNNVRMENRDVTLFTDSLNYEMIPNIGYYFDGGKLVDSQNELTSVYGQYSPDTKQSVFNFDVQLVNEKYTLYSDTLEYNTRLRLPILWVLRLLCRIVISFIRRRVGIIPKLINRCFWIVLWLRRKDRALRGIRFFTIGDRDSAKCSVIWCSTTPFVR